MTDDEPKPPPVGLFECLNDMKWMRRYNQVREMIDNALAKASQQKDEDDHG